MAEENKALNIQVRLRGEAKTRFLEIKDAKGLTNNTEVLRLIINEYFEKNLAKEAQQHEFFEKRNEGRQEY